MPNTVGRQLQLNGSRNYVTKFTIVGDGSGEETGLRINTTTGDLGTDDKLMRVWGVCTGCTAQLLWDATTDLFVMGLPSDKDVSLDFRPVGGLVNNAGAGKTGDLLITTAGLGAGDTVTLELWFVKKG